MNLVVDLLGAQHRGPGEDAVARSVTSLALALEERAPGTVDTYLVRAGLPVPGRLAPIVSTGRVRAHDPSRTWLPTERGLFVSGSLFDLAHPQSTVLPRAHDHPSWLRAAVLHDLHPLHDPDRSLPDPTEASVYRARTDLARSMDLLLAVSEATADDARALLGIPDERIVVIGAGADDRFRIDPRGHEVAVAENHLHPPVEGLRARFLLCPAAPPPRGNLHGVTAAFAALPDEVRAAHQLVLFGALDDDVRAELHRQVDRLGIAPDVLVTGHLPDDVVVRLHHAAHLVVVPSVYEGAGLPVLEALACGAPVVCSDVPALRELVTDATARFDPTDPGDMVDTLGRHLTDPDARSRARRAAPPARTWDQAVDRALGALGDLARRSRPPRPRRTRVALVSPLPPQRSGIADYAARFVDRLRHRGDLTVFVDDDVEDVEPIDGVTVARTDAFDAVEAQGTRFDRIVFFLGNSPFHADALGVLRRHGGTVVLHDARLTALYSEVASRSPRWLPDGGVGSTIARLYPGQYGTDVEEMTLVDPGTAAERGVHLLAEVVDLADDVLVHNRYAADLVELDTGVRPEVAFGLPFDPPVDPEQRRPRPDHVVTLGHLTPAKQPELLLDALALLRVERDVTFAFCGGGSAEYLDYLHGLISARDLDAAVEVRGFLPDEQYRAAMAEASLAVQLRAFTNGESSAAVHDALAAGVPTVLTRLGSMAEYPESVVSHVAPTVGAAELAATIGALLDDEDRRARMSREATRLAGANGYPRAVRVLLERLGV